MADPEKERREGIKTKLESGKTISEDDIKWLGEQTSLVQRLFSDIGFMGSFADELSETGQEALIASGEGAGPGVRILLMDLGIPSDQLNIGYGVGPFLSGGPATVGRGANVFLKDVMRQKTALERVVAGAIRHRRGIAAGAFGAVGLFALGQAADPMFEAGGRQVGEVEEGEGEEEGEREEEVPTEISPTGQILFVGPNGEIIPLDLDSGMLDSFGAGESGLVPNISSDLDALGRQFGIDLSQMQTGIVQRSFLTGINEFGEGSVSPAVSPHGVTPRGRSITNQREFQRRRQGQAGIGDARSRFLPQEDIEEFTGGAAAAPPGATLNRRAFEETRGRTNLEMAGISANRYGVPLDILYGTVNALSGWNALAVGDSGTSFGLAQVSGDVINPELSTSPQWALNYLSGRLRSGFAEYGSWEMAALGYRAPEEASRFLTTGTMSKVAKAYLVNALGGSQASGLGNNIFDFAGLAAIPESRGTGRQGPSIPPFQAPDPAELREFARDAFASILGRDPTEDELNLGVGELTKGFRSAYEAEVKKIRGGETTAVDPEARYLEQLEGTGEAQFREEVVTQRSVFDQMGDWARVLQEL